MAGGRSRTSRSGIWMLLFAAAAWLVLWQIATALWHVL